MAETDWSKFSPVGAPAPAAAPATSGTDWSKFKPADQAKGFTADLGRAFKAGVQKLPGAAAGLADIPLAAAGFDRPVSRLADAAGKAIGFRPGQWAEETAAGFSPETKIAQREIDEVWKDPETNAADVAGAYLRNPRTTAINVAQSVPSIVAGGAAGRVAGAVGGFRSAATRGAIGEGAVMAGQSMAEIDENVDPQRAAAAAAGTGVLGAGLGFAGGRVAQRLGISDVDQIVAGGARGAGGTSMGIARRVPAGVVQEGLLEEAPQSALETGAQNWAEGNPITEGMARNVTEGALAGGVMGGTVAAIPRGSDRVDAPAGQQDGGQAAGFDEPAAIDPVAAPIAPVPAPSTQSAAMGLDASAGPISAAAVQAVDGGATQEVQAIAAAQQAAEDAKKAEGKGGKGKAASPTPSPAAPAVDTSIALAPAGTRGAFADAEAAQAYIRTQRRAGGTSFSALPVRFEDGSFGVATRGTPEYELAKTQAAADKPKGTAEAIKKIRASKAAAKSTTTEGAPRGPQADQAQQAAPQREEAPAQGIDSSQPPAPAAPVDVAAQEAATSPSNDRAEPSQAQKEAGNYKLGHARIAGLEISVENPQGSVRRGTAPDGTAWETPMQDHYGYFRGTTAADGDKLDVFVKPGTPDDFSGTVFVVDQVDPATGKFDEAKVVMGAADQAEAEAIYRRNYSVDWTGLGAITALPMPAFKTWASSKKTRKPLGTLPSAADVANDQTSAAAPAPQAAADQAPAPARGDGAAAERVPAAGSPAVEAPRVDAPAPVEKPKRGVLAKLDKARKAAATAATPSAPKLAPAPAPKPAEKIEDFGEKLVGARKDYAATLKEAAAVDIGAEPLSKSWPEPDYEKLLAGGADPFMVSFIRAARDEVPTKPQTAWKLKGWVQSTKLLRSVAQAMLDGSVTRESMETHLARAEFRNVAQQVGSRAELYREVGHGKSLKGVTFAERHYTLYRGQENVRKWVVEQKAKASAFSSWPRELAVGDTKAEMLAQFKERLASLDVSAKSKHSFVIYGKRGQAGAFIGKKIGREYVDLHRAEDVKAARAYMAENADALEKALERYRQTPFERNTENAPRVGGDHRNGAPVTPEAFADAFGFRGVQFGNYVEQGRRQSDLNEAFDALMDMAAVIGVPPRALSLNGRLGLAFGARGKGGKGAPAAHYEPGTVVINLTKGGGPGSLAHEWFHSMDNYFAKQGGGGTYMTEDARGDDLRAEMREAFQAIKRSMNAGALRARSRELDKRRTKLYWSTPAEMAARSFESYVISKLQDQNASNDYLANVVSERFWQAQEALRGAFGEASNTDVPTYPYPTVDELPALRAAFDSFFRTVQTREADGGGVEMFSMRGTQVDPVAQAPDTLDAHDEPSQAHRDATAAIQQAITARRRAAGGDDVVLDAIAPRAGSRNGRAAITVASIAKRLFKREVVYVRFRGPAVFNGVVSTSHPGKIFLNIDAQRPLMAVLGHELLHEMSKQRPDLHADLSRRLDELIRNESTYSKRLHDAYTSQKVSTKGLDAREELEADIVGDFFMDPEFWGELAKSRPSVFKQIGDFVVRWLNNTAARLGLMRPFGTQEFLSDIAAARSAVVSAMQEFGGQQVSDQAPPVRTPVTDTTAFKNWFGDSKVVDADGKPLVVYHGTSSDITTFDPSQTKAADVIFTTPDPAGASVFAETRRVGAPNVMPLFVSIKRPAIIQANSYSFDALNAALSRSDVDGVLVVDDTGQIKIAAPISPEQIKSATGNRGTFDPANPDITLSIAESAREQIRQFDVREKPANTLKHYRGLGMQALGRRQIVDLFQPELPQLLEYNRLVQVMDAEKNDTGAEADRMASAWGALDRTTKTKGEERRLAELMHDATLARIDPAKDHVKSDDRAAWEALRQRFQALQPQSREIYTKARDMYAGHYEQVRQAIKDRIERSEMSGGQKKAMMARMDEDFFKKTQGVYFPLARFGNYVIVVRDAAGEVVNVSRAETLAEAETTRKDLQRVYPAARGFAVGKVLKDAEFNPGRDAVGKGFMADLFAELDKRGVDDALRDSVSQLYLASLPDLSWAKHGIHRKGTPGFSQDARRAFAQNMFHGARYLAKLRYSDQLQTLLTDMQEHLDAYKHVEEYDSVKAQQVVDEMVKRHENLMNPRSSSLSTALTSIGFVFYLGVSPAAAMVNLSQTALVAYPIMGAKWGFSKSSAALLKASAEVVKAKNDISKVLRGDELEAYNAAVRDGTIDVTMAHDLAGISQGEDQKVTWALRPVMRWASFLFHHAERFNRQATFIAAYRLARGAGADLSAAFEQAKQATYDGHFDYGASNRSRLMQGNVAKVVTLFKQYGQNMVYTMSRQAFLSLKGATPAERAQARKVLGGILVAHGLAAGTLGLPIVGPLLAAASFLGGDDDEPWDAEVALQNYMADAFGPKAAEVIAHGLSRLTPWDISSRVALDKLIVPDVQEGLEGQRWAEAYMSAAIGPVGGIFTGMVKGLQEISEGKYQRGLEAMLPVALRNAVKSARFAEEGAVDRSGIVIKDDVSLAGIVGQLAGFAPSEVRRATEGRSAIYGRDRALLQRRQTLMNQFAEARMAGDEEGAVEAREAIARFNEKNPTRRITFPQLMRSVRARQQRIDRAEQGVYLPRNRRDALEAGRFAVETP